MNYGQMLMQNGGSTMSGSATELAHNLAAASRKRQRDCEDYSLVRQHFFIPLVDLRHNNGTAPVMNSHSCAAISTGLKLAFDGNRLASPVAFTSGRGADGSFLPTTLSIELQAQMLTQSEEIEQLIYIQGERMKQALEEKRQRHIKSILAAVEEGVLKKLKEKEAEVEKANCRNLELEGHVKQLSLESQLWQNMAKNNEVLATSLRNSLEQVVAQSREQSKEGCGESEVDDAESCHHGEAGDAHVRTFVENKELKDQRTCKCCRTNDVCILLLPCRHLCLCKNCEGQLDVCPVCGKAKNASVQVYLS